MNRPDAHQWKVRKCAKQCVKCALPFSDGTPVFSALIPDEEGGYSRDDFCASCWKEIGRNTVVSHWKTLFCEAAPPEEPLKKETAESLLRRLLEEDDADPGVLFILAVMLERKKILREQAVRHDGAGGKIRHYSHRKTGESFLVPDPELRLDELESLQKRVTDLLGGCPPSKKQGAEK